MASCMVRSASSPRSWTASLVLRVSLYKISGVRGWRSAPSITKLDAKVATATAAISLARCPACINAVSTQRYTASSVAAMSIVAVPSGALVRNSDSWASTPATAWPMPSNSITRAEDVPMSIVRMCGIVVSRRRRIASASSQQRQLFTAFAFVWQGVKPMSGGPCRVGAAPGVAIHDYAPSLVEGDALCFQQHTLV